MLPGRTELKLNQAAMREAVQVYLVREFRDGEAPFVKQVNEEDGWFIVTLDDKGEG